jgi:prepilin-type N-terminal cleavage/methylation domain-containing protein
MKTVTTGQRGFTLIELIIAIAIAAVITGGITAAVMQVLSINTRASNHMVAVRQVQQAGKEVSKDTLQAQSVNATTPSQGFPLTLRWVTWGTNDTHEVVYDYESVVPLGEVTELQRSYSFNDDDPTVTTVAEYIDPYQTSFVQDGDAFIFTVTATLGTESETRIYEIEPRPD